MKTRKELRDQLLLLDGQQAEIVSQMARMYSAEAFQAAVNHYSTLSVGEASKAKDAILLCFIDLVVVGGPTTQVAGILQKAFGEPVTPLPGVVVKVE